MWKNDIQQRAIKLSDEIGTQKACEQLGLVYFTLVNQRINRSWTGRKRQRDNRVIFNDSTDVARRDTVLLFI